MFTVQSYPSHLFPDFKHSHYVGDTVVSFNLNFMAPGEPAAQYLEPLHDGYARMAGLFCNKQATCLPCVPLRIMVQRWNAATDEVAALLEGSSTFAHAPRTRQAMKDALCSALLQEDLRGVNEGAVWRAIVATPTDGRDALNFIRIHGLCTASLPQPGLKSSTLTCCINADSTPLIRSAEQNIIHLCDTATRHRVLFLTAYPHPSATPSLTKLALVWASDSATVINWLRQKLANHANYIAVCKSVQALDPGGAAVCHHTSVHTLVRRLWKPLGVSLSNDPDADALMGPIRRDARCLRHTHRACASFLPYWRPNKALVPS
ncbi:ORF76 [Ranid herpesvirus 1]|uniref:ORF76 n=1 Tax=Ranid herpesvirus 1 TaxID=85655 RepID=Q9YQZ2_9VIRU|nr:ORF76 [Ranid herpesvirus 1]AAD12273.1 ORF76 [Ranid herpesvirus 1]